MNDFNFADITRTVVFFADSMFTGLKFAVPVLFIIHLLKPKSDQPDFLICVKVANQLLILAGLLFIYTISSNVIRAVNTGNEAERDMMIAFATGSHWYQFFFPLINYALLPMALWVTKWRRTPETAMLIVSCWIMTGFLSDYLMQLEGQNSVFNNKTDYREYAVKAMVFLMAFAIMFGVGKWNSKFNSKAD